MMSIKRIALVKIAALFSLCFYAASSLATVSQSLTEILSKIQTYQADFSQKITDDSGQSVVNSHGKLSVSRPGKFYWKSSEPDPILVVADGKVMWTYDIELEQITKQDLRKALGSSPAALLVSKTVEVEKDFMITTVAKSYCPDEFSACYQLTPKVEDKMFSNIYIGVQGDEIKRIEMKDALGQQIVTVFTNVIINKPVDLAKFNFTPPPGVDVIVDK